MVELTEKQQKAVKLFEKLNYIYLNWEVGCGKTLTSLYLLRKYWIEQKRTCYALYLCPPAVFSSIKKMMNLLGLDSSYYEIYNTKVKRDKLLHLNQFKPLLVMSYDKFTDENFFKYVSSTKTRKEAWLGVLGRIPFEFIILDEAHSFKNFKAKRTKAVMGLSRKPTIKRKILGSGTPYSRDLRDLFTQVYVLDGGKRLGSSYYFFEQTYFYDKNISRRMTAGYKPLILIRKDMQAQLFNKVEDCFHKLKITDMEGDQLGDMKVKNTTRISRIKYVDKTIEQEELESFVKNEARIEFSKLKQELKNKKSTPIQFYAQVQQQMSVFRQIASGFFYIKGEEGTRKVQRVKTNKVALLRRALRKIPYLDKIIIWSVYQEAYKIIEDVLNEERVQYVKVIGKTSPKKREELVNEFKTNPSCRVFLSHPKAGGVGLNLQEAKWSIYFCKDYNLIDKIQSEGRNMRIDSFKYNKVIYEIDILTRGTIETKINSNISSKKVMVKEFESFLTE